MDSEDIHIRRPLRRLLDWTAARRPTITSRKQPEIAEIRDCLESLHVSVAYLLFDLHATRRENEHLRRLLEEAADLDPDAETP